MTIPGAPKKSRWQRLVEAWPEPPEEDTIFEPRPEPVGSLIVRRDWPEPLYVGARGGTFHFRVFVCVTWTSESITETAFENAIAQYTPSVENQVREVARSVAALHEPHHVVQVQASVNVSLPEAFGPFAAGASTLDCRAHARVAPDERLRDRLATHAERLIDVENDHELRVQRTKLMQVVANEWLEMVTLLRAHPMTAHANHLTDEDFADIITEMTQKRADKTARLIQLLKLDGNDGRRCPTPGDAEPD